ncbi:type VI secretion system baseplate subunit TssE [Pseudomonas sp. RGM2987]|uniref:type VI secretion system baseplate subunit TssE n=1 Tax=Pseudomonas sp. RGM2987 TaxID=2930090 RepID=UPI001FD660AE|nr:type VI secretion system baseplate subunit TssE [Pseudomonas sp. RGM2987]MCJ8205751.1 type VI secretion system baseplate subunit TssE [Pseudomonas sp. RGM2987]
MTYGSLFERLGGDVEKRVGLSRESCVTASVAAHLAKMLSTRAGSVQTSTDFGLPDLNDMRLGLHDAMTQGRVGIQAFVEAYEPRLRNVRVASRASDGDPLRLSFSIDAVLEVGNLKRQVSFCACLDGSGRVKVRQG